MATILIGYEVRKGEFPNPKTGELIPYNNRILKAITNDGEDNHNVGYSAFEEKLKLSELSSWLGVSENDASVDSLLKQSINKPVEFKRAPRNGEFSVVGFKILK